MMSPAYWLKIKQETRDKIVRIFGLKKSGYTHVQDGVVISDGFTAHDLLQLTVKKLQEYTGNPSTDFYQLFDITVRTFERTSVSPGMPVPEVKTPETPVSQVTVPTTGVAGVVIPEVEGVEVKVSVTPATEGKEVAIPEIEDAEAKVSVTSPTTVVELPAKEMPAASAWTSTATPRCDECYAPLKRHKRICSKMNYNPHAN